MKKSIILMSIFLMTATVLIGCSEKAETTQDKAASVSKIVSAEEAKTMMDESGDLIILDVRTEEEYAEGHINGALLIPDYEIETKAEELLEDKSATILVYCRSGRRSALAAEALKKLGYTSIYDFGGIIDWPYEIVTTAQ